VNRAAAAGQASLAKVYIKLVLSTAFWGGAFIAGRHLAQHMPHFVAATGRFIAALIPLLALAIGTGNLPGARDALHQSRAGVRGRVLGRAAR
jgi:drug/metabolite transporter (DMT)-like permease